MKFLNLIILIISLLISNCNSKFNDSTKVDIENYHNSIRVDASKTGPEPISKLNSIKWSNEIENNLQRFVDKCNFGIPDKSYGIGNGYSIWKVIRDNDNYDPVKVLNKTFQESATLYDWSNARCKPNQCCDSYPTMIWNASTQVGCASSYCSNFNFFICGYYPMGNFAGIRPYTPMNNTQDVLPVVSTYKPTNNNNNNTEAIGINVSLPFILPNNPNGDVNWKELGFVTPIRNQLQCGSCWSFSVCATLESQHLISNNLKNTDIDLSEQNFVNCVNYGCGGGNGENALNALKPTGVMYESDYPYKGATLTCPAAGQVKLGTPPFKWSGFTRINADKQSFINALKSGPIYASLYVDPGFQLYKSGIYSCSQTSTPNHAVTIVGYSSADNTFLIKNSWGIVFGESGFVRLKEGSCNLYAFPGLIPRL